MLRTHCQTSGVSLTEQDPYNNVVRTTIEAMAAVLGGTQSLHTNSFDEALGLPTDFSSRIARNTQLIIQEETGIPKVVDPLGGSYYVEALTQALADRAWTIIEEVEALGGMTKAVASGHAEAADRGGGRPPAGPRRPRRGGHRRREQVPLRRSRRTSTCSTSTTPRCGSSRSPASSRSAPRATQAACDDALRRLRDGAAGDGNLLALCIEAARARATVGEMSDAMEAVFGRHKAEIRSITGVYGSGVRG